MYFIQKTSLPKIEKANETSLEKISDPEFYHGLTPKLKQKYDIIIRKTTQTLGPVILFSPEEDTKDLGEDVDELFIAYATGNN